MVFFFPDEIMFLKNKITKFYKIGLIKNANYKKDKQTTITIIQTVNK